MNDATRKLNEFLTAGTSAQNAVDKLLDQHETATRTNRSNDGRAFQKEIERTIGGYHSRREAVLRKVDPPNKIVGTGAARRVIFMANPFLDFAGTWTARHGRALFIECKSTATHRLPFMRSGGLTSEQVATIRTWRMAGAAVAVLWQFAGRVVLFIPEDLAPFEASGAKSLTFESGRPVLNGAGAVLWDFLPVLAAAIWPPEPHCSDCDPSFTCWNRRQAKPGSSVEACRRVIYVPPPIVPRGTIDSLGDGFGRGDG